MKRATASGGLLRYGIPNFKMEKHLIDRRIGQMQAEGVKFIGSMRTVGGNVPVEDLRREFDAILLAGGAEQPRNLNVPGRELQGIHFAMEFLPQQNRRCEGDHGAGADSGHRQARCDHRRRRHRGRLPGHQPPAGSGVGDAVRVAAQAAGDTRAPSTPWPLWPMQLRVESSHEEGGVRNWSVNTVKFTGDEQGRVRELHAVRVGPPPKFEAIAGTEFALRVDLVLLAMGFLGPVKNRE